MCPLPLFSPNSPTSSRVSRAAALFVSAPPFLNHTTIWHPTISQYLLPLLPKHTHIPTRPPAATCSFLFPFSLQLGAHQRRLIAFGHLQFPLSFPLQLEAHQGGRRQHRWRCHPPCRASSRPPRSACWSSCSSTRAAPSPTRPGWPCSSS